MNFTGERLVPGIVGDIANEHLHRYAFASNYVKGKKVLDIACGEGYGSNLLSDVADYVCGVDISEEVIQHAKGKYLNSNLEFKLGKAEEIPYPDEYFEVVVSFETIEHLIFQNEMLLEIERVLKGDGLLIISSPDKKVYSDIRNYKNEFHEKELYADEFAELVKMHFKSVSVYGQCSQSSSLIFPLDGNVSRLEFWNGDFKFLKRTIPVSAKFIVIVACKKELWEGNELSVFSNESRGSTSISSLDFEIYKNSTRFKIANILFSPWDLLRKLKLFKK